MHEQGEQDERHHDDHDDQSGGHGVSLPVRGRLLGFPAHATATRRARLRPPVALRRTPTARSPPPTWSPTPPPRASGLMALTDHDTVDGVGEALAAAREHGLRCSPAAELSSVSGEFEDLHVCGYELRHDDPELRDTLADFRADRGRRIWAMADRLEELGFALDRADLQRPRGAPASRSGARTSPTRCSRTRRNAAKLRDEGIDGQERALPALPRPRRDRLRRALAADGRGGDRRHPRRRRRRRLGAPVLGHRRPRRPCSRRSTRFTAAGLDGVEVFYPTHDEEQTTLLYETCTRAGPAHHRLGRLPRARAREVQRVRGLRALRARAGARPARVAPGPPGARAADCRRRRPRLRSPRLAVE